MAGGAVELGGPVAQVLIHDGEPPNVRRRADPRGDGDVAVVDPSTPKAAALQPDNAYLQAGQSRKRRRRLVQQPRPRAAQAQRPEAIVSEQDVERLGREVGRGGLGQAQ